MGEPKFTPGPWEAWQAPGGEVVVRHRWVNDKGQRTTDWPAVCNCNTLPNMANANLIAAAPELYEALKDAVMALGVAKEVTGLDQPAYVIAGESALAKARGDLPEPPALPTKGEK